MKSFIWRKKCYFFSKNRDRFKTEKFSLTGKIFCEINSLVKRCFHEIFVKNEWERISVILEITKYILRVSRDISLSLEKYFVKSFSLFWKKLHHTKLKWWIFFRFDRIWFLPDRTCVRHVFILFTVYTLILAQASKDSWGHVSRKILRTKFIWRKIAIICNLPELSPRHSYSKLLMIPLKITSKKKLFNIFSRIFSWNQLNNRK